MINDKFVNDTYESSMKKSNLMEATMMPSMIIDKSREKFVDISDKVR